MASPKVNRELVKDTLLELKEPLTAYLSNPVGALVTTTYALYYIGPDALDPAFELIRRGFKAAADGWKEILPDIPPLPDEDDLIDWWKRLGLPGGPDELSKEERQFMHWMVDTDRMNIWKAASPAKRFKLLNQWYVKYVSDVSSGAWKP